MQLRRASSINTQGLWITADRLFCLTLITVGKKGWVVTVHYGAGGPGYRSRTALGQILQRHNMGIRGSAFDTRREALERLEDVLRLEQEALI